MCHLIWSIIIALMNILHSIIYSIVAIKMVLSKYRKNPRWNQKLKCWQRPKEMTELYLNPYFYSKINFPVPVQIYINHRRDIKVYKFILNNSASEGKTNMKRLRMISYLSFLLVRTGVLAPASHTLKYPH